MLEKYDYDLSPTPLQLECERLRKEAEIGKQMLGRMMSEYAELRDQLAEAKKDAERWKALCKQLWVACPTTLECRAFHHAKQDQHRMTETCRPQEEYLAAIDAVNQAMREGK